MSAGIVADKSTHYVRPISQRRRPVGCWCGCPPALSLVLGSARPASPWIRSLGQVPDSRHKRMSQRRGLESVLLQTRRQLVGPNSMSCGQLTSFPIALDSLDQVLPSLRLDVEYTPQRRALAWC
jgi:hypothetical protein